MWLIRKKKTLESIESLRGVVKQALEDERTSVEKRFQKKRKRYFDRVTECIYLCARNGSDHCVIRPSGYAGEITQGDTVYFDREFIQPFYDYYKNDFIKAGYAFYRPEDSSESIFIWWKAL